MAAGIKVPLADAEKARKELIRLGVFDGSLKVRREAGGVIFPVKDARKLGNRFEVVKTEFEPLRKRETFEDCLSRFLGKAEINLVTKSYDVIGGIAVIEVPAELEKSEERLASCLIDAHRNIKTVYKKMSRVKDDARVRELKYLAGERRSETTHREHGCMFSLDINKVYFSPRLSYERQRVVEQVKDGETIVDLFAGIGPFSIVIAKHRNVKVYAVDSNVHAVEYLQRNIAANKVADRVEPILGDCRKAAPRGVASRVIMNLPKLAHEFLDVAFDAVKKGVIHFYSISSESDLYTSKIKLIKKVAEKKGRKIKILGKRIVRPYSPHNYHIVIDIGVT